MYTEVRVDSWLDVTKLARLMSRWAFRGHASVAWLLQTAFERAATDAHLPPSFMANREFWMLRQFQRRGHIVVPSPPAPACLLEWLALIQHYGGPTRLLDFSHSVYVAAYFALEFAVSDAAIWAVYLPSLDKANGFELKSGQTVDHINRECVAAVERILDAPDQSERGVIQVEPDRLNERMAIQKGIFLFAKDIASTFMDNLAASISSPVQQVPSHGTVEDLLNTIVVNPPAVLKIILPRSIHKDAIDDLVNMNVDASTLFTGLEGFARSLHRHVRYVVDPEVGRLMTKAEGGLTHR